MSVPTSFHWSPDHATTHKLVHVHPTHQFLENVNCHAPLMKTSKTSIPLHSAVYGNTWMGSRSILLHLRQIFTMKVKPQLDMAYTYFHVQLLTQVENIYPPYCREIQAYPYPATLSPSPSPSPSPPVSLSFSPSPSLSSPCTAHPATGHLS